MEKTTRILYISYDGMTDHMGQSQVLPYLIGLTQKGFRFTLLSCEKPEKYKQYKHKIDAICKASSIDWCPIIYTKSPPVFSTIKDVLSLRSAAITMQKEKSFSGAHCRSYIPGLIGLELKKKFGVPFIFDMRGFYPEEKTEVNTWPLNNPIYRGVYNYFKRKEKEFFQLADGVISLTENGKQEINSWGIRAKDASEIKVIPCSVDFEHFKASEINNKEVSREQLGISPDTSVLTFLGSLGSWYMLEEMLDFFKVYMQKKENVLLFFITSEKSEYLVAEAAKKGIAKSNLLIKQATREEVPLFLSASDEGLFFIKPFYSKKGSSPTKLGEYLALNIPVYTNTNVGDVDTIITETNGGELIDKFSIEAYQRAIDKMSKFRELPDNYIRKKAFPYYDLGRAIEAYEAVYLNSIEIDKVELSA